MLGDTQNEFYDTSGPLFSLYSKMSEESNDNWAESYQKDAEGIVLFVSPRSCLHTSKHANRKMNDRPACSQLLSPH